MTASERWEAMSDGERQLTVEFRAFLGYAMTVERTNTETWMQGFVQQANHAMEVMGEPKRFVLNADWPSITLTESQT